MNRRRRRTAFGSGGEDLPGRLGRRYRIERRTGRIPPRRYRLGDYKRWFPKTADVIVGYLEHWKALPVAGADGRPTVGVAIIPWVSTTSPWYGIVLALGLARRGRRVVLVWDDTGFAEDHVPEQNRVIGRVLAYVARSFPVVRVSDATPAPARPGDDDAVEALTDQNRSWRLRGAPAGPQDQDLVDDIRASLRRTLPLLRATLHDEALAQVQYLVVPGGVYSTSGLFRLVAAERDVRVATWDADVNVATLSVDGVAAQNADVPLAFHELWDAGDEERRAVIATARAEYELRVESTDSYGFQTVPASARGEADPRPDGPGDVLIPLNVEWDTAALGRHALFESTTDWLTTTVTEVLATGTPVVVRQHPAERRMLQRSQLDVEAILRERFGDDPRCRFIAATDPISTYDLVHSARLVLPFVSTIGIEAAALAKPVLIAGNCYYAGLGFVRTASSRAEYLDLVRRGVAGDLALLDQQVERAWVCYYLSAVRNRVWTDFTPQPDDFWRWCRRSPDTLLAEEGVADLLEAIDTGVPVALARHRRATTRDA